MLKPRSYWQCFYKALVNTIDHDGIEHAGYLAFVGLLAIFPFLVLLVAIAGFLGEGEVGQEFVSFLFQNLPAHVTSALRPRVDEIISGPPQGLLTVAILGAIWTASSAVEGYRTVLNRAYHVNTPPAYLWRRMLSIAQLIVLTFIVIITMIVLIVAPAIWEKLQFIFEGTRAGTEVFGPPPHQPGMVASINPWLLAATSGTLLLIVSIFYYILPNIKQSIRAVAPGAVVVVFLWTGAAWLFSQYLSNFQQVNLIYGSLGGIIAALLFFYISNIIFIYGAELNYLLMKAIGSRIIQKEATVEPLPPQDD